MPAPVAPTHSRPRPSFPRHPPQTTGFGRTEESEAEDAGAAEEAPEVEGPTKPKMPTRLKRPPTLKRSPKPTTHPSRRGTRSRRAPSPRGRRSPRGRAGRRDRRVETEEASEPRNRKPRFRQKTPRPRCRRPNCSTGTRRHQLGRLGLGLGLGRCRRLRPGGRPPDGEVDADSDVDDSADVAESGRSPPAPSRRRYRSAPRYRRSGEEALFQFTESDVSGDDVLAMGSTKMPSQTKCWTSRPGARSCCPATPTCRSKRWPSVRPRTEPRRSRPVDDGRRCRQ